MKKIITNIKSHVNAIVQNYDAINDSFPKLNLAAEQINSIFDQLFVEQIDMKSEGKWSRSIFKLLFGAYSSWIQSYILTSAGYNETGLMLIRRSIEFTCYLSKIMKDHSKYSIWNERFQDEKSKKNFSSKFSIPSKYFHGKYSHLKTLIVWHDFTSDFGAHGNLTTIIRKIKSDSVPLEMVFQDDKENIPISTGVNIRIAGLIIDAIVYDVKKFIKDKTEFDKNYQISKQMINDARVEILTFESNGKYSNDDIRSIYNNDSSFINAMFEKLREL